MMDALKFIDIDLIWEVIGIMIAGFCCGIFGYTLGAGHALKDYDRAIQLKKRSK